MGKTQDFAIFATHINILNQASSSHQQHLSFPGVTSPLARALLFPTTHRLLGEVRWSVFWENHGMTIDHDHHDTRGENPDFKYPLVMTNIAIENDDL